MSGKIIHKNTSIVNEGKPKLPTSEQIDYGELAINYASGLETITIKNYNDEIVEFKSKDYFESLIKNNIDNIESNIQRIEESKQDNLESSINIKTINGETILGEGDVKINADTLGLSLALKYCGVTSTPLVDGSTDKVIIIDNKEHVAKAGCVVLYDDKEYIFNGNKWDEFGYPTDLSAKQDKLVSGDNIKTINGESILGEGDVLSSYKEVTYSDLKELRDSAQLIPGSKYRITDYVTMCVDSYQYDTTTTVFIKSSNHPFDIIVEALSNNTLSEDVKAIQHDGDTYFTGNNLDAWELKYCFDNDTSRFGWVNSDCKGVIYYMKDEFNNEVWYDFKNIMFQRSSEWFNNNSIFASTNNVSGGYFYTFSAVNNGSINDDSLYSTNFHATDNHLGRNTSKITKLNNTIFIDKPNNGVFNNIIGDGHANNTFGHSVWNNRIGHNCLNNTINVQFQYNDISSRFSKNVLNYKFSYNVVNSGFEGNTINGSVNRCNFGVSISNIINIPQMSNVAFDNQVINNENKTDLSTIILNDNTTLLSALYNNESNIKLTKYNNQYVIVNDAKNELDKVQTDMLLDKHADLLGGVYDLGSFINNEGGENAAYNIDLIRNPKIHLLRFYNTTDKKYVYIRQIPTIAECNVGEWGYAKQYIYLDGSIFVRKCWFQNMLGSYQTATDSKHFAGWVKVEDSDNNLYSNGKKVLTSESDEISSLNTRMDDILDVVNNISGDYLKTTTVTYDNNANMCGFYGKLSSYGLKGGDIKLESLTVYRRNGNTINSGGSDYEYRCKVLGKSNESWYLIAKSSNKIDIHGSEIESPSKFEMVMEDNAPALSSNDMIAIIFAIDDTKPINHADCVSLKTVSGVSGAISTSNGASITALTINPSVQTGFGPAVAFEYYSSNEDASTLHSDKDEEINSVKTFNKKVIIKNDFVITDSDGDKSVIRTSIDTGELKVTKPDSGNGFVIRTNKTEQNDGKYRLEMLTTNGSSSYQYNFPYKTGTVALKEVAVNGGLEYEGEALKIVLEPDSGLKINEQGQLTLDYDVIKTKLGLA